MRDQINEDQIPEGIRDIYRKAQASVGHIRDERVQLALEAFVDAVHKDLLGEDFRMTDGPNVVDFRPRELKPLRARLAKSR